MLEDSLTRSIYWHPLHKAVDKKDASYIKGWLEGSLDIDISWEHAELLTNQVYEWKQEKGIPGDWRMWLKKRLEALGYFPCGFSRPQPIYLPTILHVFFVSVNETPDMLATLRNPGKFDEEQQKKMEEYFDWVDWDDDLPRLATPAIERTSLVLRPVDRTAAKVVGKDI